MSDTTYLIRLDAPTAGPHILSRATVWKATLVLVLFAFCAGFLAATVRNDAAVQIKVVPQRTVAVPLQSAITRRVALGQTVGLFGLVAAGPSAASSAEEIQRQYGNVVRLRDVESPLLKSGLTAATQGNFALAEQLFTEYINSIPPEERASGYSNRGNARLSLGKPQEAYEDFSEAIRLAPGAPIPRLNRALASEAMGRLRDGIADCEEAIKLDPDESASYFNKGNMEAELGEYQAALDSYTLAADLSPGIPGYRSRQALTLNELGQKEEAVRLLKTIIRKNPQFLEMRLALSSIYWSQGLAYSAEQAFFDASRYDPRIERWGIPQAQEFAVSRAWTRRFPRLVDGWLAFVRNDPVPAASG